MEKDLKVITDLMTKAGYVMLAGIGVAVVGTLTYYAVQWGINHPLTVALMIAELAVLITLVIWGSSNGH